jgi:predicted aspartyl protease
VISQRTARRHGIRPIVNTLAAGVGDAGLRGLQLGRLDSLQVGTLKVRNVPTLIKPPPAAGAPLIAGEGLSPLALGLSMTVDYGAHVLIIGERLPESAFDTELPLRMHRLAMVSGRVNDDRHVSFVVDTGGELISISSDTARSLQRPDRHIPLKVYGTSGRDRDAFLLPGVDLRFDAIHFSNLPVVVLNLRAPSALLGFEVGGIVGHRFLSKYRVDIDLARSVVRLKTL